MATVAATISANPSAKPVSMIFGLSSGSSTDELPCDHRSTTMTDEHGYDLSCRTFWRGGSSFWTAPIVLNVSSPFQMLDHEKTRQSDLRSGGSPWERDSRSLKKGALRTDLKCDVLVVGGGITGALIAHYI